MMIEKLYLSGVWTKEVLGNSLGDYGDALIVFFGYGFVFFLINLMLLAQLEKVSKRTKTEADDFLLHLLKTMHPPFYFFIAFYIGFKTLTLHPLVDRTIFVIVVVWCTWQIMHAFQLFVDYFADKAMDKGSGHNMRSAMTLLSGIIKGGLWVIAALMILSNFGINVTSLIAGVGIGGIAIAFAVKGILEDLFSSFSIYFDKPFQVGDVIEVDAEKGMVQKIGIKTTRLKSMVTGEEIVMTNRDLTNKKINNYHRMTRRRTSFDLGVTYDTPTETIKKIPVMIEEIIKRESEVEFNRAHFRSFDDSALRFSVLYHYNSRDYEPYLDAHERILYGIREAFEKEKIEMAFPTQTIHMTKE